jgi:hypothetical protein
MRHKVSFSRDANLLASRTPLGHSRAQTRSRSELQCVFSSAPLTVFTSTPSSDAGGLWHTHHTQTLWTFYDPSQSQATPPQKYLTSTNQSRVTHRRSRGWRPWRRGPWGPRSGGGRGARRRGGFRTLLEIVACVQSAFGAKMKLILSLSFLRVLVGFGVTAWMKKKKGSYSRHPAPEAQSHALAVRCSARNKRNTHNMLAMQSTTSVRASARRWGTNSFRAHRHILFLNDGSLNEEAPPLPPLPHQPKPPRGSTRPPGARTRGYKTLHLCRETTPVHVDDSLAVRPSSGTHTPNSRTK